MIIKIIGKEKTLNDLEKAKDLIKEAEQILYRLPLEIGLVVEADTEKEVTAVQDTQ